jgi:hypothetical protein
MFEESQGRDGKRKGDTMSNAIETEPEPTPTESATAPGSRMYVLLYSWVSKMYRLPNYPEERSLLMGYYFGKGYSADQADQEAHNMSSRLERERRWEEVRAELAAERAAKS